MQNKEFRNLHSSPNIIRMIKSRRMRWTAQIARTEEITNAHTAKLSWKIRPLGRPRRRCNDDNKNNNNNNNNIKMNLQKKQGVRAQNVFIWFRTETS